MILPCGKVYEKDLRRDIQVKSEEGQGRNSGSKVLRPTLILRKSKEVGFLVVGAHLLTTNLYVTILRKDQFSSQGLH